jgi:hypothetical protein
MKLFCLKSLLLSLICILILTNPVFGQSRIPEDSNLWLQISENPGSGSRDSVQTVFFEVPESYLGPIFFGICDPEGDTDSPDQIQQAAWDSGTTYQLFMGDGAYTGANARQIFYADPAPADPDNNPPVNHDVDGTCPPGFIYEYDETNTAVQGGQSVTGDGQWVYFPVVYASQGEKVGTNRYFRMVIHADEGLDSDFKNGYQLIASKTTGTTPTEITEIRAFAYAWSVDFQNGFTWDFYPFVPDSAGATDELDLFFNDVDGEGIYTLYDIQGNTIDNTTAPGNGIWSSDTDGATDYTFGSQINGTWHLEFPIAGGGPAENTTEIWAENSLTNETLPIYSSFFKPAEPYRVVAYHDPTETGVNRKVILQLVDDSDNPVPYVRNIFIENPSTTLQIRDDLGALIGTVGAGDSYTITTNSDGFAVFTCSNSADEIVTLNFVTDGVRSDTEGPTTCSRLPLSGALGPNNSVQIAFETGSRPTLSSNAVSIVEGNIAAGINFTVTETFGGYITAGNDIYIRIPDTVDAVFNASVPVIGGSASGKVDTVVSYPDSKTMRLNVNTTLAAADTVTISGLDFTSTNTASSGDFELSYSGYTGPYNVIDSASTGFDIVISSDAYFVWDGSTDGDLTVNANWVGGTAPDLTLGGPHTAKVILTSAGAVPLLDTNYYFRELIIDAGAIPIASGTTAINVNTAYQNNGTLSINGTSTNISFAGNAFTGYPSLGDVTFDDTATGTINYPVYDNFTVNSGAWTLPGLTGDFYFNEDVTLVSGVTMTLTLPRRFYLYGNWNNGGATINPNYSLYFLGTSPSTLIGDSTIFQLVCTEPGKQLNFTSGSVQTVTNLLRLTGTSSSPITLRGTAAALWTLDNQTIFPLEVSYIDVDWADAGTADITCDYSTIGSNCDGTSPQWVSAGTVYTWNGNISADVGTNTNWTPVGVPASGDSVIIGPGAPSDPQLTGAWNLGTGNITINSGGSLTTDGLGPYTITCDAMVISSGGTLDMADGTVTSSTIQNDGTINAQAGASLSAALNSDSGTVNYSGGGAALPLGNSYYNLTFSGGVWTPAAGVIVNRDLTVTAGSFGTNAQTLTLAGDIILSGGTLDINTNFTLNGDLLNTGGMFTHIGAGNVITISGGTHLISGSNSWRSISSTVGNTVLRFQDGTTQTLAEDLTVTGTAGNLITMKGTSTAGWDMDITGTVNATYADISYSTATSGPHDAFFSQSSYSNNTGWNIFPGATPTYTWQGDDATNPTLWSVAENWDTGSVPISAAQVIIPNVAPNDFPVLDSNVTVDTLAIQTNATLTTGSGANWYDLTLGTPASFSNDGTLVVSGTETLTLTMDTDSGLVQYVDGNADGSLHFSGGAFDYFNLEIDGAGRNYALGGATTLRNNLTVTAGTLTAAANNLSVGGALDNQAAYTSTTGDISVTGDAILDGTISSSGAANHAFAGGISSLTGSVTTAGATGTIDASGFSANLTLAGTLDAGIGTVTITTGIHSILDNADGGAVDITAKTIDLDGIIGGALGVVGNPLETSSATACIMSLPSGNVSVYIDHTGILSPSFGGNRTTAGAINLSLVSTLGMNLPGASLTNTGTGTIDLIAGNGGVGTLDLPANCTVSTANGDMTLSGDLVTLNAGAGTVDATGIGNISITATGGALALDKQVTSNTGSIDITAGGGTLDIDQPLATDGTSGNVTLTAYDAINQSQPVTANLLTVLTINDAGAVISLNNGANNAVNVDLRSQDTAFATEIADITYSDTDSFTLDTAETTGNMTFTAGGAVTLGAAMEATGVLTLTAADLNDGGFDITTAGNVDLTFSGATTALTNTWNFTGTTAMVVNTNPLSLNDVQIGINGNLALTGAVSQDIAGDFAVTAGGTTSLDITNDSLSVGGNVNFTNLDTLTSTGSTLTLNGGAIQTLTSATPTLVLNHLIIDGAGATLGDAMNLSGNLTTTNGSLDFNQYDVDVTGTLSHATNILLTGDPAQNVSFGTPDINSGTFTYDGAGAMGLGDLTQFYNLTFTDTANRTLPADITVYGDLNANAATGIFTLTNRLITFDGTAGTYTPPATPANFTFYDITIATGRTLTTGAVAGDDIVISHNWTQQGTGVLVPGFSKVIFVDNSVPSTITGNTTFYDFTCTTDNKTLSFAPGSTQTISNILTLQGSAAAPATMVHLTGPGNWTLNNANAGNLEVVDFVTVERGQVLGFDITANDSVDVDATCDIATPGWDFTAKTVTWTGLGGTNWDTGASWNLNYPPNTNDTVIIADVANQPIISTRNITVDDLTIQDSGSGTLQINDGWDLTMTTAFNNQGELIRLGNNDISRTDTDSGRTIYRGTGGTIQDYGVGDDYCHLEIENAMDLGSDLQVAGDLFIDGGSLDVTVTDYDITLSNTLIGGDWINTGTFTGRSATVTMAHDGDISGMGTVLPGTTNNFYNLTISGGVRTSSDNLVVRNQLQVTGGSLTMSGVTTLYSDSLLINGGDLTANVADVNTTATVTNRTFLVTDGDTLTAGGLILVNGAAGVLDTRGIVNANAALTVTNGTFTAGNGAGDTVNITGNLTQSGGTIDGSGSFDISGQALLSAGTLEGLDRTINVAGNWTESGTFVFDVSGGVSTVIIYGASTITTRAINSFDNLTINNAAAVLGSIIRCNNNLALTGTGSLDVTATDYGITVVGRLVPC